MKQSRRSTGRSGFTLIEMVMVIVIVGILASLASPKLYRTVTHSKVNEAAGVVASDLEQAVTLARRTSRPVQLALESTGTYTLRDRATSPADSLRLSRQLSNRGDQGVESLTFSRTPVQVFPDGTTDGALTVTLSGGSYSVTVSLSSAGMVRIN